MKSLALILFTVLLMADVANAQYAPSKRSAREAAAATTERQNVTPEGAPAPGSAFANRYGIRPGQPPGTPPPGTPPPAAPPAAPAPPVKPSAQQVAATKLKAVIGEARGKGEEVDVENPY